MPKKSLDPRSDAIALHYRGDEAGEPNIPGVPARDLTENDLCRLVFVRSGHTADDKGFGEAVTALMAELSASDIYAPTPAPAGQPEE